MKKIVILLFLMAFTQQIQAKDYNQYCSTNSVNKNFSGNIASITGFNTLSRNIIEGQIQKAIKKETNSKFNIKINNFFGSNVLNGEFKSLKAVSKKYAHNNIFLSDVNVETICPYNHISYEDEKLLFDENMVLKYSAKITQEDLNEMINSSEYKNILDKINNDKIVSSLVKVQSYNVEIKNDKLLFKYDILPLPKYDIIGLSKGLIKPITFNFGANLKVTDGKIEICDFALNSKNTNYGAFMPIINKLNPTSWKMDIDKNNEGKLEVESVKIVDSQIEVIGYIIVEKNK